MTDQKHYPMPELSEQENELALRCAKNVISASWANDSMKLMAQVALAALTAPKPEAVGKLEDVIAGRGSNAYLMRKNRDAVIHNGMELYTAPPVPEHKKIVTLPEVGFKAVITELNGKKIPAMSMVKGGNYLHRCRVRGILEDLGYEVKE